MVIEITYRLAARADIPALEALIPLSARQLQRDYYSSEQLDGAIGTVFGLDTQLIKDGTYFVALAEGVIVGCGGWSRRITLYGGDRAKIEADRLRDPQTEPAMIRAFFVHPDFARRGIGREFIRRSEIAATAAGFQRIEIVATLAGELLYTACGYVPAERISIEVINGLRITLVKMKREENPPPTTAPTLPSS